MTQNRQILLVLLVITALVTAFWWPTLTQGKSLIHGDSIVHGLPLMDLHARALRGEASVLWSEQIYGGHPIFAEGQGAFAHPLNILMAALVPPVYGHNLFHFICMLLLAIGTLGLSRCLGASVWSAGFAGLAAAFAATNIGAQQNMTIGGTITWIPWVWWAFEYWLKQPDLRRAMLLAVACSLMILAGYPQLFHGVVVYMAASLLVMPFSSDQRLHLRQQWPVLLMSGLAAVALCIGLVAVQLLPLFELTRWSHRAEGVGLIPFMPLDSVPYLRGLLFASLGIESPEGGYVPSVGSALVCGVAACVLIFRTSIRCKGHLLATLLLVQLGLGIASPMFRLMYEYHLLPGLTFFRTMLAYLNVASVGIAVLSAFGLDALRDAAAKRHRNRRAPIGVIAISGVLLLLGYAVYADGLSASNAGIAVLAAASVLVLWWMRGLQYVPVLMACLLVLEIAKLHVREFHFGDSTLLARPATYELLHARDDVGDYRLLDLSARAAYAFKSSHHPKEETAVKYVLAGYVGMTNVISDVSSLDGALALPMKARMLLTDIFRDEIAGKTAASPGQRAIDLLAIRFIVVNEEASINGFPEAFRDEVNPTLFLENSSAKPRFQTWTRHVGVTSPEQALALIKTARNDALIVQVDGDMPATTNGANDVNALRFTVREATSTRYEFDVDAKADGWLFVADANYAGWKATLDGVDVRVYTANVLGKAVRVPTGTHRVVLYFESTTFRFGLVCSIVSVLIVVAIGIHAWRTSVARKRAV